MSEQQPKQPTQPRPLNPAHPADALAILRAVADSATQRGVIGNVEVAASVHLALLTMESLINGNAGGATRNDHHADAA